MPASRPCVTALLLMSVLAMLFPAAGHAATIQMPEFFRLTARLTEPPQVGQPCQVTGTIEALIGNLTDVEVSLMVPTDWPLPDPQRVPTIAAGKTWDFSFTVTPAKPTPTGSIVCRLQARVPKTALQDHVQQAFPNQATEMKAAIAAWPDPTERFTDISFALIPEEGFYPLGPDMWTTYEDRLRPPKIPTVKRGPAWFEDPLISPFQAATDVEMYDKLSSLLASDSTLTDSLLASGIDLAKKQFDFRLGLYVLAAEAFRQSRFAEAEQYLDRLLQGFPNPPSGAEVDLEIAANNLQALCAWAAGDRRRAEETFRKIFYRHRKHPLQRYVLRSLGLLLLDGGGDLAAAREMFRLAVQMKPAYTLASQEYEALRAP
jgi:hypothetical protein